MVSKKYGIRLDGATVSYIYINGSNELFYFSYHQIYFSIWCIRENQNQTTIYLLIWWQSSLQFMLILPHRDLQDRVLRIRSMNHVHHYLQNEIHCLPSSLGMLGWSTKSWWRAPKSLALQGRFSNKDSVLKIRLVIMDKLCTDTYACGHGMLGLISTLFVPGL